ncbi:MULTISPECIES: AAA family ATPase [unclassified Amycolatopsis]|uniref:helix-turn-helix transcriptional regulator n=1 Tax=unclassified Amycolatopsis TaxID=2618356 RepID=UPI002876A426|nr:MULTISPECIES: AAA family ATPase [unclassified Amycolatopsis]MDS0136665.1 helix-turn-helix transcriptional regulator [Amycolatopsis sp. 505]MDS0143329.1 helix-turn-helix transcriptional regulator [Amycolatopsis sp. CM201R]
MPSIHGHNASTGPAHRVPRRSDARGREAELARLTGIVDGAEPGVRAVRVSGDPWSGKSELLAALAGHAKARGWAVACGAAGPLPGSLPFGVFSDALDDLLASPHPALLDGFPEYHVCWLAGIFPALAQYAPDAAVPTDPSELRHLFHAVRALLERLSAGAPLLLVVDDLQWADPASADLFTHLIRRPPNAPVLLVTALRPRQTAGDLLAALDGTGVAHIALPALPEDYLGTLLPPGLPAVRRDALLDAADGNPGLLRALAAAEDTPDRTGGPGLPVSPLREFRTLGPFTWTVAHAAALLRESFDTGLLATVVDGGEGPTGAAVDELVAHDILRVDGSNGTFRFRNPLLRATAHQAAGAAWRLGAHARAAAALRDRDAPAPEVAHHLAHCALVERNDAAGILVEAAREVRWERPADAAAWLRRALDARGPVCADHVPLLAIALVVTGRTADARVLFDQVAPGPETALWAGRALHLDGHREAAADRLRGGLRVVDPGDHRTQARLVADLLATTVGTRHPTAVPDLAILSSVKGVPGLGPLADHLDPAADAGPRALLLALATLTDPAGRAAEDQLLKARTLMANASDADLAPDVTPLYWLARAEHALARDDLAGRHLHRALAIATRFGHRYVLGSLTALLDHLDDNRHPEPDPLPDADMPSELAQLSGREREISRLVSDGRTNQQIARTLGLSHKTVETYLARIFKKLALCSRAQLATIVGRSVSMPAFPHPAAPPAGVAAERLMPA